MVIVTSVVTLNVIMLSVVAPEEVLASVKRASLSFQNVKHDLKSFINWNNEEYLRLQLKADREARKWHLKKKVYNQKWESPQSQSVLLSERMLWAGVSTPDFWNETAVKNVYDHKWRQTEKQGNDVFSTSKMEKPLVPIYPFVCGNALSECVNTWFLKLN